MPAARCPLPAAIESNACITLSTFVFISNVGSTIPIRYALTGQGKRYISMSVRVSFMRCGKIGYQNSAL
jgi:hypothetical protein